MGTWQDTTDALKDGDTSSGNFWIAIIVIVLVAILFLCAIVLCFVVRRYRRKKRLQQELNDIEPAELWQNDGTAPLANGIRPPPVR